MRAEPVDDVSPILALRCAHLAELPRPTTLVVADAEGEVVITASKAAYDLALARGQVALVPLEVELLAAGLQERAYGREDWRALREAKSACPGLRLDATRALGGFAGLIAQWRAKTLRPRWTLGELLEALGMQAVRADVLVREG